MSDWRDDAACRGVDPELFFDRKREKLAFQVCDGCEVRDQCLDFAQKHDKIDGYPLQGVWGGQRFGVKGPRKGAKR